MTNETKKLTPQESFDIIVAGVIAQGAPAFKNGKCFYRLEVRTEEGSMDLKCAVGQIIPDTDYREEMENKPVIAITERIAYLFDVASFGALRDSFVRKYPYAENFSDEKMLVTFLSNMQEAHDDSQWMSGENFVRTFKENAARVADRFELDKRVCD